MITLPGFNKQLSDAKNALFLVDIPMEIYLKSDAISRSDLSVINDTTPLHYKHFKTVVRKQTQDMLLGSAIHTIFFENEKFLEQYLVAPQLNLRKKDDRLELEEFRKKAKREQKTLLTEEQMETCFAVSKSLDNQKHIRDLIQGGVTERSIYRPFNDLVLKTRPDYYIKSSNTIIDLKTTSDLTPDAFLRSVLKYGYHVQDAFYCDSVSHFTGSKPRFIFVAVEKKPPYQAAIYELGDDLRMVGRSKYLAGISLLERCQRSESYPGFSKTPISLKCPNWLWTEFKRSQLLGKN